MLNFSLLFCGFFVLSNLHGALRATFLMALNVAHEQAYVLLSMGGSCTCSLSQALADPLRAVTVLIMILTVRSRGSGWSCGYEAKRLCQNN